MASIQHTDALMYLRFGTGVPMIIRKVILRGSLHFVQNTEVVIEYAYMSRTVKYSTIY